MGAFSLTYTNSELRLVAPGSFGPSVAVLALPEGLVRTGRINNPDTFAALIKQAMLQATPHPIRSNKIIVGLPEEQAFVKLLQLPANLSKSELRSSVEYQWQNVLPIPPDQVFYDCCYVQMDKPKTKLKTKTKKPATVLIVAYPKDIVTTLLIVLHQLNLSPELFLPESFGFARLYSLKEGKPAILLGSLDGRDVSATIIKDNLTLFSTSLHAAVDDPKVAKQVENLKEFYIRSTEGAIGQIKDVLIEPTAYAGNIGQNLQTASIEFQNTTLPTELKKIDPNQSSSFIGLVGLTKNRFTLSILPPELVEERLVRNQFAAFRSLTVILLTTLSLMTYFSFIFFISLQSNSRSKVVYSDTLSKRIESESATIGKQVAEVNTLINRLAPLESKRTQFNRIITAIVTQSQQTNIVLQKLTYGDSKFFVLEAKGTNQDDISKFIEGLRATSQVGEMKQEILSTSSTETSGILFRLAITLKGPS